MTASVAVLFGVVLTISLRPPVGLLRVPVVGGPLGLGLLGVPVVGGPLGLAFLGVPLGLPPLGIRLICLPAVVPVILLVVLLVGVPGIPS